MNKKHSYKGIHRRSSRLMHLIFFLQFVPVLFVTHLAVCKWVRFVQLAQWTVLFVVKKTTILNRKLIFLLLYRCACIRFDKLPKKERKSTNREIPSKSPRIALKRFKNNEIHKRCKSKARRKTKKKEKKI